MIYEQVPWQGKDMKKGTRSASLSGLGSFFAFLCLQACEGAKLHEMKIARIKHTKSVMNNKNFSVVRFWTSRELREREVHWQNGLLILVHRVADLTEGSTC